MLHEINMNIVTHPTTFSIVSGFFFSGTHCKGVSKQLCVYHLYRNVFLAQTRIRSHLGCISSLETRFNTHNQNAFRNAFIELLRLSSISQYREYGSPGMFCHCGAALRNFIRNTMHLKAFQNSFAFITSIYRNVILAQTRIRSPFFPRFRKAFLTPQSKQLCVYHLKKNHPESRLETLILHQKKR